MSDFFERKKGKDELKIPTPGPYDLSNLDNDLESCGLDSKSFEARYKVLFSNLGVDPTKENAAGTITKRFEESFSSRELSFLLAKDLLRAFYEQQKKEEKTPNKTQ